ncbi:GGDEF domain-containing protein [Pseudomonas viridiflava]|uniref:GGDEF domain-containing protein n=1 Tax=Pseudomonas viridiflava TaxID=33069 RepID=UPI000F01C5BD|nr:diguanylate cyclase [Pseudomonas viridiflava]
METGCLLTRTRFLRRPTTRTGIISSTTGLIPAIDNGAVTVSIGAMTVDNAAGMTPQAMLKSADNALYEAKHLGRNQVCFATTLQSTVPDVQA